MPTMVEDLKDLLRTLLARNRVGLLAAMPPRTPEETATRRIHHLIGLFAVSVFFFFVTWVASPIKFQADMGLLLAFMFLWNMLGALVLLPALAHFLLKPAGQTDIQAETMGQPLAQA